MFTIGEFSLISRLTVKTLRYYHDEGILVPDYIDDDSGYRYYRQTSVERAMIITMLRDMDFSINGIREMLSGYTEDTELLEHLEKQQHKLKDKISQAKTAESSLEEIIKSIRRIKMNTKHINYEIQEKQVEDIIFAGFRFKGKYDEVGSAFKKVGRKAGRFISGNALTLYYDCEYKENDADIEAGFPVSKSLKANSGIDCKILKGGKSVTIVHKGPYESLNKSYEKLFTFIEQKKYKSLSPSREVYLKGPGMIFKGNPENYLTEIQVLIQ
jgi:effector-binding domain-containing protein/DNA-binding transcriptional MerR regulator